MEQKIIKSFERKLKRLCKRRGIEVGVFTPPVADYTECYFDDGIFAINVTVWNCNIIEHRHCHREVMQEALTRFHIEYAATSGLLHSFDKGR